MTKPCCGDFWSFPPPKLSHMILSSHFLPAVSKQKPLWHPFLMDTHPHPSLPPPCLLLPNVSLGVWVSTGAKSISVRAASCNGLPLQGVHVMYVSPNRVGAVISMPKRGWKAWTGGKGKEGRKGWSVVRKEKRRRREKMVAELEL